jgi:hypothetical protein
VIYLKVTDSKYWEEEDVGIDLAVKVANNWWIDYIILVFGENFSPDKPGDLQDLTLSKLSVTLAAKSDCKKEKNCFGFKWK